MGLLIPFAAPAAGALAATGAATTVPAIGAWGVDALAAYRAATAGYSVVAGAATGATTAGLTYTAGAASGAYFEARQGNTDFATAFDQRFSYWGLGGATAVGAIGGAYQTQMLQWANIEKKLLPSLQTPGGWVIRANKAIAGNLAGKATQAAVEERQPQEDKKAIK
ncbi:hypothetical protein [Dyella japonica]|uniref:hypothetical protein n=1 Tax=Dyella japonica TaxID=231455 RepID=UPI0012E007BF|nr:hypothetical protein [Dyella japonica]